MSHLERGDYWNRAGAQLRLSGPQQESIVTEQIQLEEYLAHVERDERSSKKDHSREEVEQRERLMRDEEDRRLAHEYRAGQLQRKRRD